jgi:hypothetical protein
LYIHPKGTIVFDTVILSNRIQKVKPQPVSAGLQNDQDWPSFFPRSAQWTHPNTQEQDFVVCHFLFPFSCGATAQVGPTPPPFGVF